MGLNGHSFYPGAGRGRGERRREKGEGRREKGDGRREKGEGRIRLPGCSKPSPSRGGLGGDGIALCCPKKVALLGSHRRKLDA